MFRSSLPWNGCSIDTTVCVINRYMAKITTKNEVPYIVPEVVETTPLYEINSTAYAVKVEYNLKDSLHSSVVMLKREDGDPIPTNMNVIRDKVLKLPDYEPNHSIQWIMCRVTDPDYRNPDAIDDNIRPLEI